jgi:hypothetical protein
MIPVWQKVQIQDVDKETPGVKTILTSLNALGDSLVRIFSGHITADNIRRRVVRVSIGTTDFPVVIPVDFTPEEVRIIQCRQRNGEAVGAAVQVSWQYGDGSIVIDTVYGLTAGIVYTLKIVIL